MLSAIRATSEIILSCSSWPLPEATMSRSVITSMCPRMSTWSADRGPPLHTVTLAHHASSRSTCCCAGRSAKGQCSSAAKEVALYPALSPAYLHRLRQTDAWRADIKLNQDEPLHSLRVPPGCCGTGRGRTGSPPEVLVHGNRLVIVFPGHHADAGGVQSPVAPVLVAHCPCAVNTLIYVMMMMSDLLSHPASSATTR